MASKRSSRSTFQEDAAQNKVKDRRQSRPFKQEEMPSSEEKTDSRSSSNTGSRSASMSPDLSAMDVFVGDRVVVAVDPDVASAGGRVVIADDLKKPASAPPLQHPSKLAPPMDGRPFNFGLVVPGVYRSSYPTPQDFAYMKNLGLKTVVTLGKKDEPDQVYVDFMAANSIRHHIIDMKGTKKQSIPINTMKDILRIVLDQQHYPLMIHCNHGKHRTGCVVAVVRKVSGWKLDKILDEYRTYATPKVREVDVEYITSFELSQLSNLFLHEANMRFRARAFLRATVFACVVMAIWTLTCSQMSIPGQDSGGL